MTTNEFKETIDALFTRQPFRPFVIELKDSIRLLIEHGRGQSGLLWNGKDGRFLFLAGGRIPGEAFEIASVVRIAECEPQQEISKTHGDLATRWRQRPFTPFRIIVAAGTTYDVRGPGQMILTRESIVIGLPPNLEGIYETTENVDLFQIVRIEPLSRLRYEMLP
jgi:hypothetical protein